MLHLITSIIVCMRNDTACTTNTPHSHLGMVVSGVEECIPCSGSPRTPGMNLLSYFCIAVSAIQNHNCVAVFDFD